MILSEPGQEYDFRAGVGEFARGMAKHGTFTGTRRSEQLDEIGFAHRAEQCGNVLLAADRPAVPARQQANRRTANGLGYLAGWGDGDDRLFGKNGDVVITDHQLAAKFSTDFDLRAGLGHTH